MSIVLVAQVITSVAVLGVSLGYSLKCGHQVWRHHRHYKNYYEKDLSFIFRSQDHWTSLACIMTGGSVLDFLAERLIGSLGGNSKELAKDIAHQIYIARCVTDLFQHLLIELPKRWKKLSNSYYNLGRNPQEELKIESLSYSNDRSFSSSTKLYWASFFRRVASIAGACLMFLVSCLELIMFTWDVLDAFSQKHRETSYRHMAQNGVAFHKGLKETWAVIGEKLKRNTPEKKEKSRFTSFFIKNVAKINDEKELKETFNNWNSYVDGLSSSQVAAVV